MSDAIRIRDCVIADLTVECKELRAELAAERAKFAKLQDAVLAVLCDPEGNPCFRGSDGDRAVIAEALDLTTQLAAKESAEQEPVARVNAEGFIVEIGDVALANGTKLYTSSPTTSAAVAAFRRKAAEVCRESSVGYSRTNHDGRSPVASYKADACDEMAEEIAALPANDSALREVCMRVAKRVYEDARFRSGTVVTLDDAKAIVSGVLDDSR